MAFSPEREDPGNKDFATRNIPKVVGGLDATSRDLAVALYTPIVEGVVPVSGTRVAEACKILENTYRDINIALVNELKVVFNAMGIDVWEVIRAAKTKPFGFQAFYPGPGLGGHCIPIDPFYLTWAARKYDLHTRFIELAGEINASMPQYVVERIGLALNVSYNDPHIPTLPAMRHHHIRLESQELTESFLASQDCVVIITDHSAYDVQFVVDHASLVLDTRNATANCKASKARIWKA